MQTMIVPGRFSCPACPRRFTTLHLKKDHLRISHPKPKATGK